ncbi:nucleoside triphosphate pyrophosphohydrolase ham1 [Vermiconidia calcicola]|uniref:Nucleoside triphosphate pyrophosphohydrolase ham1 n=1 Tax=Vermiconidia calcicola TaxID=1690605 RepID=A0ACC3NEN2_9PEZI|nr:nucleoside triphosphate pyrophosphohydrolase ham1 [Vermiconidia calcicola]
MAPKELNFITGNNNKLKEVQAILSETPVKLQSQSLDLPELQGTIEEITKDKCGRAADLVRQEAYVLRDLGVVVLIYMSSKWFLKALGVHQFHKLLAGFDDKSAQAVCTFAYCEGPGHEVIIFQGRTHGKIVEARGPTDFDQGWDACFEHEGQTYAEMRGEEKNKISHRGKALEKLKEWLKQEV